MKTDYRLPTEWMALYSLLAHNLTTLKVAMKFDEDGTSWSISSATLTPEIEKRIRIRMQTDKKHDLTVQRANAFNIEASQQVVIKKV
jgi:hypothetical protein